MPRPTSPLCARPPLCSPSGSSGAATAGSPARLGPDSDVGRAALRRVAETAPAHLLAAWRAVLPRDGSRRRDRLHGGPDGTSGSRNHAARMLALADEAGIPAILTAAVRHIDPIDVRIVDVLDAARRLVLLDRATSTGSPRRGTSRAPRTMHRIALEVAERAGLIVPPAPTA
jgi:error-prone DNA polymerase